MYLVLKHHFPCGQGAGKRCSEAQPVPSLATHPALTGPFAALVFFFFFVCSCYFSCPLSVLLNIASSGLMHRKAGPALNSPLGKAEFSPPPASSAGELTPADSDFVLCIVNWEGPWVPPHHQPAGRQFGKRNTGMDGSSLKGRNS